MRETPPVPGARRSAFRTVAAEAWTRDWIVRAASRSRPPLESVVVETSFGPTHLLRSPEAASGRDVVCFPGWGTNCAFWCVAGDIGPLAEARRVWIADVPGQPGLSAGWAPTYGPDGYGRWIEELLDALSLTTTGLMGASLGGLLALQGAARLGARVDKAVLLAPAGFVRPALSLSGMWVMLRHQLRPTVHTTARFLRACVLGPHQDVEAGALAELEAVLLNSARGFRNRSRIPPVLPDTQLAAPSAAIALIVGEDDPVFSSTRTVARGRRVLSSDVTVEVLAKHGHGIELSRQAMIVAASFLEAEGAAADERFAPSEVR